MNIGLIATIGALLAIGASVQAAPQVPAKLTQIVEKTASFGLKRYPVSFWNYTGLGRDMAHMGKNAVQDWADVGFTVPMSPEFNPADPKQKAHIVKMLKWCEEKGLKMIVCDPRGQGVTPDGKLDAAAYEKNVTAAYKDFGKSPALFGFHVGDEPNFTQLPAFCEAMRIQKKVAPKLHAFGNLVGIPTVHWFRGGKTGEQYLDDYAKDTQCDFYSYDYYTQLLTTTRGGNMQFGEEGIDAYFANLNGFRTASHRNGLPFWNTVLAVGHLMYRCPDYNDIRWQFNTSVCSGANGVQWFFYYMREPNANYRQAPIDEFWQPTQGRYNLSLVQNTFHKLYGDLFNKLVCTKVMYAGKVYGGGKPFAPDAIISNVTTDLPNHPVLIGEFADAQGTRYVMIVNNSQTVDAGVNITFVGADVKISSWNWSGTTHVGGAHAHTGSQRTADGLVVEHWLAPGQEAVYKVESAALAKEPIVLE